MIKVNILGAGNVASHLIEVCMASSSIHLEQVYNRSIEKIEMYASETAITADIHSLKPADIYIIAVGDKAIEAIAKHLTYVNGLVVHTSGATDLTPLEGLERKGVFYPLQSFSKGKPVAFEKVPLCLEATSDTDYTLLYRFANRLSEHVYILDAAQRKQLHIAAVFVNNFVNQLYVMGEAICETHKIPFEILHPLILETAEKIQGNSPSAMQTGPAVRGDLKTLESHQKSLSSEQATLYSLFSDLIQKTKQDGSKL